MIRLLLLFIWSISLAAGVALLFLDKPNIEVQHPIAKLAKANGVVQFRSDNYAPWFDISQNQLLQSGATIATGRGSSATVNLFDGHALHLEAESQIVLLSERAENSNSLIDLLSGTLQISNEAPVEKSLTNPASLLSLKGIKNLLGKGDENAFSVSSGNTRVSLLDKDTHINMYRNVDQDKPQIQVTSGKVHLTDIASGAVSVLSSANSKPLEALINDIKPIETGELEDAEHHAAQLIFPANTQTFWISTPFAKLAKSEKIDLVIEHKKAPEEIKNDETALQFIDPKSPLSPTRIFSFTERGNQNREKVTLNLNSISQYLKPTAPSEMLLRFRIGYKTTTLTGTRNHFFERVEWIRVRSLAEPPNGPITILLPALSQTGVNHSSFIARNFSQQELAPIKIALSSSDLLQKLLPLCQGQKLFDLRAGLISDPRPIQFIALNKTVAKLTSREPLQLPSISALADLLGAELVFRGSDTALTPQLTEDPKDPTSPLAPIFNKNKYVTSISEGSIVKIRTNLLKQYKGVRRLVAENAQAYFTENVDILKISPPAKSAGDKK